MPVIKARPFPFEFPTMGLALLVIDMQRDFIEDGGFGALLGNDVSLLRRIVPTTQDLIEGFRTAKLPVIHTKEGHKPDLSDCPAAKRTRGKPAMRIGDPGPMGRILVSGEPGNDFVPELAPTSGDIVISKPGKGAFYATVLDAILKSLKVSHLAIAGVTTEVCVQTSMREANDRGYECVLVEDATESYFPQFKQAVLEMVRSQGAIIGWTATCDDVLAGLGVGVSK